MDQLQLPIGDRPTTDTPFLRDAGGRRQEFTSDELDALADGWWRLAGAKGRLMAFATALLSRLSGNAGHRKQGAWVPTKVCGARHAPSGQFRGG